MLKIKFKRLFIALALGTIPIAISYIVGWWWIGTLFLLVTIFAACTSLPSKLSAIVFSAYAIFGMAWVLNGLFGRVLTTPWESGDSWRLAMIAVASVAVSAVATVAFWLLTFTINAKFMLNITDSLHISF